jgi:hypothetical protein
LKAKAIKAQINENSDQEGFNETILLIKAQRTIVEQGLSLFHDWIRLGT